MAWVVTSKLDDVDETNALEWDLPSASFAANSLIYLVLMASDQGGATEYVEPTASGLTFEFVAGSLSGSTGLGVWIAQVGAGGFTGVINVAVPSGTTQHEVLLYWALEITGHDTASPVTRYITAQDSSVTTLELDLGASGSAADALSVAAMGIQSAQTITPDAGWDAVSLTLTSSSTPARAMRVYTKEGTDESMWGSWISATTARGVLVELNAATVADRAVDVSFVEMEVGDPPSSDRDARISWAEIEVPTPGIPQTEQWEQSDLDGGGALNAVAASDDGSWLLAGSDVSGVRTSIDGGLTWNNANRGIPDGGFAVGGIKIKPGSTTEALICTTAGVFYTDDQALTWERITSAFTFGSDSSRPRPNTGHIIDSVGDYAYMVDALARVHRFRWSTQTFSNTIVTVTGVGEGIAVDRVNPTIVYVGTRSGAWRITSADVSPVAAAFTGSGTPTSVMDMVAVAVGTTTHLFVAQSGVGIKRATGALTGAWTNISPTGHATRDWQTVAATTSGSSVVLAALCQNGPELESTKWAPYWYSNSGQAASPLWTPPIVLVNEKGGPGGDPWWSILGDGAGGKAALDSNVPVRDSNHSAEDATWFLRDGTAWLITAGQQGAFLLDRAVNEIYPAMERLGTAEVGNVVADPNTPGRFYAPSNDQNLMGTTDKGEQWYQIDDVLAASGHQVFDVAFDSAISPAQPFIAYGQKGINQGGKVMYQQNPFTFGGWTDLGLGEDVTDIVYGPIPNTDPNPTPDFTYSITGKTASQIQSQLQTYGNGAAVRLTGTGPGGWNVTENNQTIFGPAIIDASGSNDGIEVNGTGNTLSDLEVKNAAETGILVKSTASDTLIRRCYAHDNDQRGIGGNGNHTPNWGVVVDSCTIEHNGYDGLRLGNNQGGMKWVQTGRPGQENSRTSSLWIKNCTAFHNRGNGIWCDIACDGVTFEHNESYENVRSGFSFEISAWGVLKYNKSYDNGTWPGQISGDSPGGFGFKCTGDAFLDVDDNMIYGNTDGGVLVLENWRSDIPGGPDFETAGEPGIFYPALATTGKGYAIELARVRHNVLENGTSMPSSHIEGGIKNTNYDGQILIDTTPPSSGSGTSLNGAVPLGLSVFRAANPVETGSPTRRFIYAGFEGVGLVRQVISTSSTAPTKVSPLQLVSGSIVNTRPAAARHEIVQMDNDTLLVWDFTRGVYIVKSARAATPVVWQAWAFTNDQPAGENWIAKIDSDRALISVGAGSAKGVYLLEDIATAANGNLFGTQLGRTAVSRPGGGTWNRPGPVAFSNGKALVSDLKLKTYPAGDTQIWTSTTDPYTGSYSEITDAEAYRLLHDVDGIALDAEGQVMVALGGGGAATYRLLGGAPGVEDRWVDLSWVEAQLDDAPRATDISWAELELPEGARILDVSWVEMEIPEFDRAIQVAWAEMEIPVNALYRMAQISYAAMEVPDAPRSTDVSWAEMETPDEFIQHPEGAVYVGMSGRILVPIRWRMKRPFGRS